MMMMCQRVHVLSVLCTVFCARVTVSCRCRVTCARGVRLRVLVVRVALVVSPGVFSVRVSPVRDRVSETAGAEG